MASKTPEDIVKEGITTFLDSLIDRGYPVYWERRQAVGPSYKLGLPDLWATVNGHHLEIEVKAKRGQRSAAQIRWGDRFGSLNCQYVCPHSVDDFKKFMEENYGIK